MAKGRLLKRKGDSEDDTMIVVWLKERYKEYIAELNVCLGHEEVGVQVCGISRFAAEAERI